MTCELPVDMSADGLFESSRVLIQDLLVGGVGEGVPVSGGEPRQRRLLHKQRKHAVNAAPPRAEPPSQTTALTSGAGCSRGSSRLCRLALARLSASWTSSCSRLWGAAAAAAGGSHPSRNLRTHGGK